jgi:ubiquinone/menaquinone biosynthesis C-methylase UbiE
MTDYKKQERSHYNSRYENDDPVDSNRTSLFDLVNKNADIAFNIAVKECMSFYTSGKVLDYGCGTGEKSFKLASDKWLVFGIDISDKAIDVGRKMINGRQITLQVMDCENMSFEDGYFDVILDYGTLSSINQYHAARELARVMKPGGALICIETLGHNPIGNLNRRVKTIRRKRTSWATSNIMTTSTWKSFSVFFDESKTQYFNIISTLFIPILYMLPKKYHISFLNRIWALDNRLCSNPYLKKYAFKTVSVFLKN